jgi:hypothetical protein
LVIPVTSDDDNRFRGNVCIDSVEFAIAETQQEIFDESLNSFLPLSLSGCGNHESEERDDDDE